MNDTGNTPHVASIEVVPTSQDDVRLFIGVAKAKDLVRSLAVTSHRQG